MLWHMHMGVDHRGTSPPPEFGVGGTLRQIVNLRFRHTGTKMSVLWPSKYAKIRFRPGLCPGPPWGSSRRSHRPPSRLEREHPSPYPTPLGTDLPSALAMRPPRSPARSTPMHMQHNLRKHQRSSLALIKERTDIISNHKLYIIIATVQ